MPVIWVSRLPQLNEGSDKAELAKKLGAHHYIDSTAGNPADALQALGGATVVLMTSSGGKTVSDTIKGLRPGGVAIVLGAGPMNSSKKLLGFRKRSVALICASA